MSDDLSDEEMCALMLLNHADGSGRHFRDVSRQQLISLVAGEVSDAERKALLELIVNDGSLYAEWVALSETSQELAETAPESKPAKAGALWERMRCWLSEKWVTSVVAPALATALVVWLLLPGAQDDKVNALYNRWSNSVEATVSEDFAGFRGGEGGAPAATVEQQWLEWGMTQGLEQMGPGFQITGLPSYALQRQSPTHSAPASQELVIAGRLLSISYFFCQQKQQSEFFREAVEVARLLKNLPEPWSGISGVATEEGGQQARKSLCQITQDLINQLIVLKMNN